MKLNYDIEFDSYLNQNGIIKLTDNTNTYYFVPCIRPKEDLKELMIVNEELILRNIATHSFILNKNKQLLTTINNTDYVLLKLNYLESCEFNLNDIYLFNKLTVLNEKKSYLYRNDWDNLWSSKIDYFEYQIRELGKGKKIIQNSLSYYIGLAENAIAYVNQVGKVYKKDAKVVLSRKRLFYPNYAINYLNPLNYIFDLEIRDIAEYIKAMFFTGNDIWVELDAFFKKEKFTPYVYHMFYARLLYPSFYFDRYEKIMNNQEDEEILIEIVEKVKEYEDFLLEIYHYLNNFVPMIPIDWLIKKETL